MHFSSSTTRFPLFLTRDLPSSIVLFLKNSRSHLKIKRGEGVKNNMPSLIASIREQKAPVVCFCASSFVSGQEACSMVSANIRGCFQPFLRIQASQIALCYTSEISYTHSQSVAPSSSFSSHNFVRHIPYPHQNAVFAFAPDHYSFPRYLILCIRFCPPGLKRDLSQSDLKRDRVSSM